MHRIAVIAARADAFCARLNEGLTAVAIALAMLTVVACVARHPDVFRPVDAEWPSIEASY